MAREFVIGDLHGCSRALACLVDELRFKPGDLVVTLGDYVDRGPDSRGLINALLALREQCRLVTLRGNHEVMMMEARHDPQALQDWLACGGKRTLESYGTRTLEGVPAKHWEFLEQTARYHETARDIFVHANVVPELPLAEQPDYALFWDPVNGARPHASGKRMICGHTAQKSGRPLNLGHALCIDTWVYGAGWLTCLEARSGCYWQANQMGNLRDGQID